jgi:hypothetical protein
MVTVLVAELDALFFWVVVVDLEGQVGQVDGGVGLADASGAGVADQWCGRTGRATGRCRGRAV